MSDLKLVGIAIAKTIFQLHNDSERNRVEYRKPALAGKGTLR